MNSKRLHQTPEKVNPLCVTNYAPTIEIYPGKGVFMSAGIHIGNPTGKGGGPRGKVKGWSKASRRRMRNFLMTHTPDTEHTLGCTFTIPGPPLDAEVSKGMFASWCKRMKRIGICVVWRMEIQKRGQLHWHCIVGIDKLDQIADIHTTWVNEIQKLGPVRVWHDSKLHRGLCNLFDEGPDWQLEDDYYASAGELYPGIMDEQLDLFRGGEGPRDVLWVKNRWMLPGASKRAIDIVKAGSGDAKKEHRWYRYLFDHATKGKQEQIAVNCGRHWGVVNRRRFTRILPDEVCELTHKEYARVVRWLQRLCTPYLQDEKALFSRRRGFTPTRGRWGKSSWFSYTDTVRRMITHSLSLSPREKR